MTKGSGKNHSHLLQNGGNKSFILSLLNIMLPATVRMKKTMNSSSTPKNVLLHIIFPFEANGQQQSDFLLKQQNSTQGQNTISVLFTPT